MKINLPRAMGEAMAKLADEKENSSNLAANAMESGGRIRHWFSVVYHRGYLHGFFRALGYAQHHAKEGRLRRLRKLWEEVEPLEVGSDIHVKFSSEAYNEVSHLMQLRFGVKLDAESPTNISTTG